MCQHVSYVDGFSFSVDDLLQDAGRLCRHLDGDLLRF
jgi:hypothetical protein